jgi:hypothetical protein
MLFSYLFLLCQQSGTDQAIVAECMEKALQQRSQIRDYYLEADVERILRDGAKPEIRSTELFVVAQKGKKHYSIRKCTDTSPRHEVVCLGCVDEPILIYHDQIKNNYAAVEEGNPLFRQLAFDFRFVGLNLHTLDMQSYSLPQMHKNNNYEFKYESSKDNSGHVILLMMDRQRKGTFRFVLHEKSQWACTEASYQDTRTSLVIKATYDEMINPVHFPREISRIKKTDALEEIENVKFTKRLFGPDVSFSFHPDLLSLKEGTRFGVQKPSSQRKGEYVQAVHVYSGGKIVGHKDYAKDRPNLSLIEPEPVPLTRSRSNNWYWIISAILLCSSLAFFAWYFRNRLCVRRANETICVVDLIFIYSFDFTRDLRIDTIVNGVL